MWGHEPLDLAFASILIRTHVRFSISYFFVLLPFLVLDLSPLFFVLFFRPLFFSVLGSQDVSLSDLF